MFRGWEWPGSATARPRVRKWAVPESPPPPPVPEDDGGSGDGADTVPRSLLRVSAANSYTAVKPQLGWLPAM